VVTHLYNAMPAGTAREPTLVATALAREDVAVELIADGHHVAADTLLAAWRAAAGRFALVSDAVAAAGLGPGEYRLGGRTVTAAADGSVRGPEGQLAGSGIALLDAVRHLHGLGVPLEHALHAATAVPARLCGRPELADLAPGTPADVVVLADDLTVSRVLVGGR
jgi:N-acetylglucosamine-6-phosphate deacetylase